MGELEWEEELKEEEEENRADGENQETLASETQLNLHTTVF